MSKDRNNKKGFTLAEVLITLSIIGVIAAILFPSILANFTERTLNAKRQALIGRMSQAMGEMTDQFRNYASVKSRAQTPAEVSSGYVPNCSTNPMECVDDGSALKFINEGLSKVYKLAAVCDNETLSACDIPDEITRTDGTTFSIKEHAKSLFDYNPQISAFEDTIPYDTDSAGIMTKNGESMLLFYNPNCGGKLTYTDNAVFTDLMMCVNVIYDLNGGKKKPNKIGEDIGFFTVLYNDAPYLAAPRVLDLNTVPYYETTENTLGEEIAINFGSFTYDQARAACAAIGDNVGLPSVEEGRSMQINRELWAPAENYITRNGSWNRFWTSTLTTPDRVWLIEMISRERAAGLIGTRRSYSYLYNTTNNPSEHIAVCVYKD